jgi:hypothetical protein
VRLMKADEISWAAQTVGDSLIGSVSWRDPEAQQPQIRCSDGNITPNAQKTIHLLHPLQISKVYHF